MKGYIHVYTGTGKGKTTAAIGLAVRAVGAGLNVYIGQFIKSGKYSEILALERFEGAITCEQFGRGGVIREKPEEEDLRLADKGLERVRRIVEEGRHDMVILDEADVATHFNLFEVDDLLALIDSKPDHVELVFTGRGADPRLVERADLVTEMREVKHYYREGVLARKGIES